MCNPKIYASKFVTISMFMFFFKIIAFSLKSVSLYKTIGSLMLLQLSYFNDYRCLNSPTNLPLGLCWNHTQAKRNHKHGINKNKNININIKQMHAADQPTRKKVKCPKPSLGLWDSRLFSSFS